MNRVISCEKLFLQIETVKWIDKMVTIYKDTIFLGSPRNT